MTPLIAPLLAALSLSPTSDSLGQRALATFRHQDDSGALDLLRRARAEDPSDPGIPWRQAFVHLAMANREKDGIRRKALWAAGSALAESLVVRAPDRSDSWFVGALALGVETQTAGARRRVELSKKLRIRLDRCLALDRANPGGWYLLGRWHEGIASLSAPERFFANMLLGGIPKGASMDSARLCLEHADKLHPGDLQVLLDLARIQSLQGRRQEALATCRRGLSTPPASAGDLANLRALDRLRRELEG